MCGEDAGGDCVIGEGVSGEDLILEEKGGCVGGFRSVPGHVEAGGGVGLNRERCRAG